MADIDALSMLMEGLGILNLAASGLAKVKELLPDGSQKDELAAALKDVEQAERKFRLAEACFA